MLARIIWIAYSLGSLAAAPAVFYLRYGRRPIVSSFPPRDRYSLIDAVYGGVLFAYTLLLLFGPQPEPCSLSAGLVAWAAAVGLQLWAFIIMGPNWRFGQDPSDGGVRFVSGGPFRYLRHPIYTSLVIIAIGQGLLGGFDARTLFLLAASLAYLIIQGKAETDYWHARRRQEG